MGSNSKDAINGRPYIFDGSSSLPLFCDGKQVVASDSFDVVSPVTHKTLYKASAATDTDVQNALQSAQRAFHSWSKTKPSVRRDILLKAASIAEARAEELKNFNRTETGASAAMADFEFGLFIDYFRNAAGLIPVIGGTVPTLAAEGRSGVILREPYGVVLGVTPWNGPFALGGRAVIAPIAAGNTVILKGPEAAPGTTWAIASVLHEAGLPPGVLNTIIHTRENGAQITGALVSHPFVKKISFTGSTAVGSIIAGLAGKHLKPVLMELGGKAPAIVCADADLQTAAQHCALGAFLHAGQICMSTERILVHESIVDAFIPALKTAMDHMWGTGPTPQLIASAPVAKNKKLITDAVSKGAKTVYGDAPPSAPSTTTTNSNSHDADADAMTTTMKPVILTDVKPNMDIFYTESFGPTVSLIHFADEAEALAIANDTDYGLSSAVFTQDLRTGLRIARGIETGAVHVNSMSVHDETALPHGGAKKSGWGRFNGLEGLQEWVRCKSITWDD